MALVGMRCSRTLEIVYSSAVLGAHFAYRAVTYRTPIPEARPCLTRNSGRPADPSTQPGLTARPGLTATTRTRRRGRACHRFARPGRHARPPALAVLSASPLPALTALPVPLPALPVPLPGLPVPAPALPVPAPGPEIRAASLGVPAPGPAIRAARLGAPVPSPGPRVPRDPAAPLVHQVRPAPRIPRAPSTRSTAIWPARGTTNRNRHGPCPMRPTRRTRRGLGRVRRAGVRWRRRPAGGAGGWSWPADWS
jgi:hypothetical protein